MRSNTSAIFRTGRPPDKRPTVVPRTKLTAATAIIAAMTRNLRGILSPEESDDYTGPIPIPRAAPGMLEIAPREAYDASRRFRGNTRGNPRHDRHVPARAHGPEAAQALDPGDLGSGLGTSDDVHVL